ncbi:MAG: hypothetical protein ACRC76_05745 [Proteocatella sp.]
MLARLVSIIKECNSEIESGTLFCNNYIVSEKAILQFLYNYNCFENTICIDDININNTINVELSLSKLTKIGFYDTCENFICKNRYEKPESVFYIYELDILSNDNHFFIKQYNSVLDLITSIQRIAKHTFSDVEIINSVISNEALSVIISFDFSYEDIKEVNDFKLSSITNIITTLEGNNLEKRNLFINEFIDFIKKKSTNDFKVILNNLDELYQNCENSYLFYISNYSSNKLKFELDSKAIDFSQKICAVISEAQTKLIAIPTAFVLAAATMDFDTSKIISVKNIAVIMSLWIFALLIQLFLNNQESILGFIELNIDEYKKTFNRSDNELINNSFKKVESSLKKQTKRLQIIKLILWLIPIAFTCLILFTYYTIHLCTALKILALPILFCIILVTKILMK